MIWWRDASLPRLFGVHVCSIGGCPCRVVADGNPSALSGPSVRDRLCGRTVKQTTLTTPLVVIQIRTPSRLRSAPLRLRLRSAPSVYRPATDLTLSSGARGVQT